jgi:hypothetical protein
LPSFKCGPYATPMRGCLAAGLTASLMAHDSTAQAQSDAAALPPPTPPQPAAPIAPSPPALLPAAAPTPAPLQPVPELAPSPPALLPAAEIAHAPPEPEPTHARCPAMEHCGLYDAIVFSLGEAGAVGAGPSGSASIWGLSEAITVAVGGTPRPGLAVGGFARVLHDAGTFHGGPIVTASVATVPGGPSSAPFTVTGNASATQFEIGPFVDWFPKPTGGWHLGAGAHVAGMSVYDDAGESQSSKPGLGGVLFGGWQNWVGPRISLGFEAIVTGTAQAGLDDKSGNSTGYRLGLVSFELAYVILLN